MDNKLKELKKKYEGLLKEVESHNTDAARSVANAYRKIVKDLEELIVEVV